MTIGNQEPRDVVLIFKKFCTVLRLVGCCKRVAVLLEPCTSCNSCLSPSVMGSLHSGEINSGAEYRHQKTANGREARLISQT